MQVSMNDKNERVRLIGVDTPETVHPTRGEEPYGREASNFTKDQLTDQTVRLEFDVEERDKYGRLLAYVWLDEQMFNETLLQEGYAQLATYPPNVKYVERFKTAQKEARQAERGLWGMKNEGTSVTAEQPGLGKFVGSTNSKKYHRSDCQWGQTIKPSNQVWFDSAIEAQNAGYEPCASCKP